MTVGGQPKRSWKQAWKREKGGRGGRALDGGGTRGRDVGKGIFPRFEAHF